MRLWLILDKMKDNFLQIFHFSTFYTVFVTWLAMSPTASTAVCQVWKFQVINHDHVWLKKKKGYVSCSLSKPIFGAYDGHFSKQRQLGLLKPLLPCAYCLKYLLKTINTQWSFLSTKTLSLYDNDTQKKLPKQRIAIPIIISDWLGEIHELFEYHFKEKYTLFWAMSLMDVIKSIKQENTHNETMNLKERSFSSSLAKKRRWST